MEFVDKHQRKNGWIEKCNVRDFFKTFEQYKFYNASLKFIKNRNDLILMNPEKTIKKHRLWVLKLELAYNGEIYCTQLCLTQFCKKNKRKKRM